MTPQDLAPVVNTVEVPEACGRAMHAQSPLELPTIRTALASVLYLREATVSVAWTQRRTNGGQLRSVAYNLKCMINVVGGEHLIAQFDLA